MPLSFDEVADIHALLKTAATAKPEDINKAVSGKDAAVVKETLAKIVRAGRERRENARVDPY